MRYNGECPYRTMHSQKGGWLREKDLVKIQVKNNGSIAATPGRPGLPHEPHTQEEARELISH